MSDSHHKLPGSLYGMAIAEPMHLDFKVDGAVIYVIENLRGVLLLWANYVSQGYFLYELWTIEEHEDREDCDPSLWTLQYFCVTLFIISLFTDFKETLDIFMILHFAKGPEAYRKLGMSSMELVQGKMGIHNNHATSPRNKVGAVLVEEAEAGGRLAGYFKKKITNADMGQWHVDGMGNLWRVYCVVCVAVPKLVISAFLAYLGAVYIMKSSNSEAMLLNTLAVLFIIEVDEILYFAFTSEFTKDRLENMESVQVPMTNQERYVVFIMNSLVYPIACLVGSVVIVKTKRKECE